MIDQLGLIPEHCREGRGKESHPMPSSSTFLGTFTAWSVVMSRQNICQKLLPLIWVVCPTGAPVVLVVVELTEVLLTGIV